MGRIAADTSVFHAIADPTRRAILDVLKEDAQTVMVMLDRLRGTFSGLSQSACSQHLAVLRRAGLVSVRKSGRMRTYAIQPEPLVEVADWISEYDKFWTGKLDNLRQYLDKHGAKPRRSGQR